MPNLYDKNNPLTTSAEILLGSENAAEEHNIDLDASLVASGLSRDQIASGEGYLPLHKVVAFLNHAAAASQRGSFSLAVAKHQPPLRFAMTGQLVRFAPTLGEAISGAIRFSILNSQYSIWALSEDEEKTILKRETRVQLQQSTSQLQTLALALTYKAMMAICQRRIPLSQVTFSHRKAEAHDELHSFFDAPILYNHSETSLVFPKMALEYAIPTANPQVYRLLWSHLERLAATNFEHLDLIERLRLELRQSVGSRRCTLEGVCQTWGVHPRSLQRSLRENGTSFRALLLGVRQELAEAYLRDSSIPVLELADLLGYRNSSAFSRAFKQQAGLAPEHWRLQFARDSLS